MGQKRTFHLKSQKLCSEKNDVLFYAAFFMMVFAKAFGLYREDRIYYVVFALSAVLLAVRILIKKKTASDYWKIGGLLIPSALVFMRSRETTLLFTCLFLAASKDIDFEASMKWSMRLYFSAIPMRLLLYFCGLVEGGNKQIYLHNSAGEAYLAGYTYGYGYPHPNIFFISVFIAVLLLIYVRKEEIKLWEIFLAAACILAVFTMTMSKTGLIIFGAVLLLLFLYKFLPKYRYLVQIGCGGLILLSIIVGIILPILYSPENPVMHFINKFVITGRLYWAKEALLETGIHLLGAKSSFVDILYIDVLLNSGIVGFCLLMAGVVILPWSFWKDHNEMGLICAAAMILYACMEQFPLNIAMNPFLLYLGTDVLFKPKRTGKENIL